MICFSHINLIYTSICRPQKTVLGMVHILYHSFSCTVDASSHRGKAAGHGLYNQPHSCASAVPAGHVMGQPSFTYVITIKDLHVFLSLVAEYKTVQ